MCVCLYKYIHIETRDAYSLPVILPDEDDSESEDSDLLNVHDLNDALVDNLEVVDETGGEPGSHEETPDPENSQTVVLSDESSNVEKTDGETDKSLEKSDRGKGENYNISFVEAPSTSSDSVTPPGDLAGQQRKSPAEKGERESGYPSGDAEPAKGRMPTQSSMENTIPKEI